MQCRYIDAVYCDDIREEIRNKFSYMGIYNGELNVPQAPIVLPKLCVAVKIVTDIKDPISSLEVRVLSGNEEVELINTGRLPGVPDTSIFDSSTKMLTLQLNFVMSPFQIDRDTVLRVKARTEREGEELQAPGLRIRVVPPDGQTPNSGTEL